MTTTTLTTIETSGPGEEYSLFKHGPNLSLHLAAPRGLGVGPCLCGFDRFTGTNADLFGGVR